MPAGHGLECRASGSPGASAALARCPMVRMFLASQSTIRVAYLRSSTTFRRTDLFVLPILLTNAKESALVFSCPDQWLTSDLRLFENRNAISQLFSNLASPRVPLFKVKTNLSIKRDSVHHS